MKILDYVLILAVLATAVFSALNLKQIPASPALPVPITAGGQPTAPDTTTTTSDSPHPRAGAISASPVIQVAVGLVCVLFGAIACFPLFADTKTNR